MDLNDPRKLDNFLGNVDKISDLIKNLNSSDETERNKAIIDADNLLKKESTKKPSPDRTGVNRTVINKNAYSSAPGSPLQREEADQEAFMKAMEKDAQERADRKKAAKAEATVFKDEGNSAFRSGDYEQAVKLYSQGLEKLKDFKELWTNRAQAYMKLEKYKEALEDCDWAQRCDEKFVKAYVLEAKAHLAMHAYDTAISVYEKAISIDGTKEKLLLGLIAEAELAKNSANQEKDARKLFESGAQHPATLIDVLNKVNAVGELPLYYDGGVRVLADLLQDDKCKTLFRTEGGLEIYFKHPFFSRVMLTTNPESLSKEEMDACGGMFLLLSASTYANEESQRQLICQPTFPKLMMKFLDAQVLKKKRQLRMACLSLLLGLSEGGRKYLTAEFDVGELLRTLFDLVAYGDSIAVQVLKIVNNMALDNKFKKMLHECLDAVLSSFQALLSNDKDADVTPSCITIMTNLCSDDRIRKAMANRPSLISVAVEYLNKYPSSCLEQRPAYQSAVHSALGFLMNITLEKTDSVKLSALDIMKVAIPFLDKSTSVQERVMGLLSHILPLSTQAVEHFISDQSRVDMVLNFLSQPLYLSYTVKSLAACTQHSTQVCLCLARHSPAVTELVKALHTDNEVLLGNACLCLGHCVEERSVSDALDKESMKRLLVVVREAKSAVVKQNAAILVGKLVKASSRHLDILRELDGIGILHNSTKYYKL